jgi:hypothetical protein
MQMILLETVSNFVGNNFDSAGNGLKPFRQNFMWISQSLRKDHFLLIPGSCFITSAA